MGKMVKFEVGKRVPSPFDREINQDESILELDASGAPVIALYYFNMTNQEARGIAKAPIQSGYFAESQYWMGLIKVGSFTHELTFNPMKHLEGRGSFSHEFFRESQLVTILGISCPTLTLKAFRVATYPPKFLDTMYLTFARFEPSETYNMIYDIFLGGLRTQTLERLWNDCTKTGNFGATRKYWRLDGDLVGSSKDKKSPEKSDT